MEKEETLPQQNSFQETNLTWHSKLLYDSAYDSASRKS